MNELRKDLDLDLFWTKLFSIPKNANAILFINSNSFHGELDLCRGLVIFYIVLTSLWQFVIPVELLASPGDGVL